MAESSKRTPTRRERKRVEQIQTISEHLATQDAEQARTEALQTARAIALAGLPKRKSKKRDLIRTLRLGTNLWLRVIYSTGPSDILPYGQDRFVLAGIQNLALEQGSPVVFFEQVSELLKMFGLSTDGRTLRRLRERFKRLAGLSIRLVFAESEQGLEQGQAGESSFIIQKYLLPTRRELHCHRIGELSLPRLTPDQRKVRYGVVLSPYFWEHLQEPQNRLILPLDLMRLFIDSPTGWDYAAFLVHRCSRAKVHSVIEHNVLMSLFKDGVKERDSHAIARLRRFHQIIVRATNGRLNAVLEPAGHFPSSKKGGRPKKRWILRVGPSKRLIWSGKKSRRA